MGKSFQHTAEWPSVLGVKTNAPLDTRQVVEKVSDLTEAFTDTTVYNTMIVGVEENGGIYVLTNKNNWKTAAAWKKLASSEVVEEFSGVFQFKGVASAINEAQDVLTIPSSLTVTHGGKTYDSVYCMATSYEFDEDLYYGWGTDADGVLFWTAKPQVGRMVAQYVKGEKVEVTKVILKGITYYKTEDTIPMLGQLQSWESLDGEVIYTTGQEGANAYSTPTESPESLLGTIITETFFAYDFTETVDRYETNLLGSGSTAVRADESTVGHVYQLDEYEYASNGHIWVKLGSPVEDWIII